MTVSEFVNRYNTVKNESDLSYLIEKRFKRKYVPFHEKFDICCRIEEALRASDNSSVIQYMLFMLALVSAYTDIVITYFDKNNVFIADHDFDLLKSNGLLQLLLNVIPEQEASEFNFIMSCVLGDSKSSYPSHVLTWNEMCLNLKKYYLEDCKNGKTKAPDKSAN